MTLQSKVLLAALALTVAFAFGRYSAPTKPNITQTKAVVATTQMVADKDTHKQTQIIVVRQPSGAETTTTTIKEDTVSVVDTNKQVESQTKTIVTQPVRSTVNISAMFGVDVRHPNAMIYGAQVSKQLLGPVQIGVYGMSNSVVGFTIGLNF